MILNLLRIIFAIAMLCFGSYYDIKTRTIPNNFWVVIGLVGLCLFECQIIIDFNYEAFQYLIVIIPLVILFLSFLVCNYVIDFEKRNINESWVFLIAITGFVFFYLIFLEPISGMKDINNLELILPIIFFLLYFIFILSFLNYLEHRAYKSYINLNREKKNKKSLKEIKSKDSLDNNTSFSLESENTPEDYFSWALFFGSMGFIIIVFIMSEIVMMKLVRNIGFIILIAFPLILIFYYYWYHLNIKPGKENNVELIDIGPDISIDDLEHKPPNRILVWSLFFSLIIFGFLIIIYYSLLEQLSNIIAQTFILMIWLVIFYAFYNFGIPRGGADTKALMAIVILFPIYPMISYLTLDTAFFTLLDRAPITASIFPFAFTVLVNAAFIMLFYIIILVVYNAGNHDLKFPHSLLGYKLNIKDVPNKFVWPLEKIQDGKRKFLPFPDADIDIKLELKNFKKLGIKEIWVTPKIPFIVPMTIGLVISVTVGNIIFQIIGGLI